MMKMKNHFIYELEQLAKENNIPIINKEGLSFLQKLIKDYNIKSVLEIGSAIGYSAINMALLNVNVVTIERDYDLYLQTLANIEKFQVTDKVFPIYGDALEIEVNGLFDLIFIDAAKAQYIKFFEKYSKNLSNNGLIVADNLNFHNLDESRVSRHTRQLLRKLKNFREYLINNTEFETVFYQIGDGISVSQRKIK